MEMTPIIPIVAMVFISLGLGALCIGCRSLPAILRRIGMILMLFMINLRMVIPGNSPEVKIKSSDVYVLFVIDDTISMLAEDYRGNGIRLEGAKEDCCKIVEELEGAKFSVIDFHNTANIMTPYTDNVEYVQSVIRAIYPLQAYYASGTSINVVNDLFWATLNKTYTDKTKKTIVFFVSDGEITANEDLEDFSESAGFILDGAVLGYGTKEGGVMWVQNAYTDEKELVIDYSTGGPAISVADETNLQKLSGDLGIDYVNMNNGMDLSNRLARLKSEYGITAEVVTEVETEGEYTDDFPIYFIFVGLLAGLLIWEFVDMRRRA